MPLDFSKLNGPRQYTPPQHVVEIITAAQDPRVLNSFELYNEQYLGDAQYTIDWRDEQRKISDAIKNQRGNLADLCALAIAYLGQACDAQDLFARVLRFTKEPEYIDVTLRTSKFDHDRFVNDESYRAFTIAANITATLNYFSTDRLDKTLILCLWAIALDQ